ncbi:MAG: hypothetical protein SPL64_02310 [Bacteroidaceae bacterium]|nr:hypothetical protein [Bacteroidaceae bacterium]
MTKHLFFFLSLFVLVACRGDDELLVLPTSSDTQGRGTSFYLLCEGNMGSNKASLDFFDGATGQYRRNIFPATNPSVALELGDVGNDLQIYGSRLYAVINCSNLLEVMDGATARHMGHVDIPNCRYVAFAGGYAYVSSYAGRVGADPAARLGYVAKVDTLTLQVVDTVCVGYQPEQPVVVGDKLFVPNSGGYMAPHFDDRLTVVSLNDFKVTGHIRVAPNLNRAACYDGKLYVQSRGNYADVKPDIYVVNPHTLQVEERLGIEATNFCISNGRIYALHGDESHADFLIYDLVTRQTSRPVDIANIQMPYGLAVDPQTHHILLTDAKDYVSPGTVHCYDASGRHLWQTTTGDIPAHFAFVANGAMPSAGDTTQQASVNGVAHVFDYSPAPGQFVNLYPSYAEGDDAATMRLKALQAVARGRRGIVALGAFGGTIVVGMERRVENVPGQCDLRIFGNAFEGNSEPGIVSVMADDNGNGLPDDKWYVLSGSHHTGAERPDTIIYYRPSLPHTPVAGAETWINDAHHVGYATAWGESGYLAQNIYHRQSYYPQWVESDSLRLAAIRLAPNATFRSGSWWLAALGQGYADNAPNSDEGSLFDIDWAVDPQTGERAHLGAIHFVRIQTAMHQQCGPLGETSTEFCGIEGLH